MTKYKLTIRKNFPVPVRRRAGVEVPREGGVVVELTDEQLAAIQDDPEITVEAIKDAAPKKAPAKKKEA